MTETKEESKEVRVVVGDFTVITEDGIMKAAIKDGGGAMNIDDLVVALTSELQSIRERLEEAESIRNIILSGEQIIDLSRAAGLPLDESIVASLDDDSLEAEFIVCFTEDPMPIIEEDEDSQAHGASYYHVVAYSSENPEEGVYPLGSPVDVEEGEEEAEAAEA